MNDNGDDGSDYPVGYKKTPVYTRFSSTHQPTNRGSRKGSLGMKSEMKKLLSKEIVFKVNGVPTKGFPLPTVLMTFLKQAVMGHRNTAPAFLEFATRILGTEDMADNRQTLSSADEELLAEYMRDYLAERDAAKAAGTFSNDAEAGGEDDGDGDDR